MSVEFEEQTSATKEAYRKLGQGIQIFHDSAEAELDIIAIPGLGTDPVECWTYKSSRSNGEPISLEDGPRREEASKKSFNWIRDPDGLAQLYPRSRIMLYNYASAWRGKYKVRATMKSICEFLLEELNDKRKDVVRPLIFICHSMGGIVVAKALAMARAKKEYEPTLTSTMGCAFFGVPFRGSNMAQLALLYSAVLGSDAYNALLEFLKTEKNDTLDEVTDNFVELSRRLNPPMEVFCVWEMFPTATTYTKRALKDMPGLLQHKFFRTGAEKLMEIGISALGGSTHFVSKESACLMGAHTIGLNAGHSDLVQFESFEAEKFRQIRVQLHRMIQTAKNNGRKRAVLSGQNSLSHNFIKTVQRSLEGVDMRLKYRSMTGNARMSSWLTSEALYQQWLTTSPGAPSRLWLTGTAGQGKTNACLAALQQLEQAVDEKQSDSDTSQNDTFLAYFLCDRSTGCDTAEDLLKGLITQLISQETSLAQHARWFVSSVSDGATINAYDADIRGGAKATATVENLWKCLQDIMEDPVVYRMHIVISNLHYLQLTESTSALLSKLAEHKIEAHGKVAGGSVKWLLSSRKEQQFSRIWTLPQISLIDLDNAEYGAKIRDAREKHAKTAIKDLKKAKRYNVGLGYLITNTVHNQSLDEAWIDVICILLKAKPSESSDVDLRKWLETVSRFHVDQLIDHAWKSILKASGSRATDLEDLMHVLTIIYEPASIADLVVLTGIPDPKHIVNLVQTASPILSMSSEAESVEKVVFSNPEFGRRLRFLCYHGQMQVQEEREKKQHGFIASSCFEYIKDFYHTPGTRKMSSPDLQTKSVLARSGSIKASAKSGPVVLSDKEIAANNRVLTDVSVIDTSPSTYPAKYLFRHLSSGFPDVVDELCEDDENFWGKESAIRDAWLEDFRKMTPELNDLTSNGMSALHISAGIGADELVERLVKNNGKESLAWTNVDGMTALHVAAFNNHLSAVETLIRLGANIEAGHDAAGTPLHWAALRGHSAVMELLIKQGANVNAYSQAIGPVINAAIRSGSVDAVQKIMTEDVVFDSDYTKCEPPLSLSAKYSKPELFKDILNSGRDKWLQNVKLIDRALVEAATSGHLQSVRTLLDFPHIYANDTLEDAIDSAAREVNWAPADVLLDFAIEDTVREARRNIRLDEVFYLAAAGRDERLEILERMWRYARRDLQRTVVDFSLYEATALRKPRTAKWLLETCGADPNATSQRPHGIRREYTNVAASIDYGTVLNAAASTGNAQLVEMLIQSGARVDDGECYALQLAAAEGHPKTVETLIANGAAIDRKVRNSDKLGFYHGTALQVACDNNRVQVVELLIKKGANPNLGGGTFDNPITSVTQRGHHDILKLLLESPAIDVNVKGTEDKSYPLINAAAYMDLESLRLLLDKGAKVDAENGAGDTALILAAAKGKLDCVKLLCEYGANVIHKSPTRGVPITVAADALQPDCARILADIMVDTIEKYSENEPRLNTHLAETKNELIDLRAQFSDAQQHRDNLLREIDVHKQKNIKLRADGEARADQTMNKEAEIEALRVQLFSKAHNLNSVSEQLRRAEDTIHETEKLLDDQKQANDTLRQRDGWVELQQQRNDAISRFEAESAKGQSLSAKIEELEAADQVALKSRGELETQLEMVKSELEYQSLAKKTNEALLAASDEAKQGLTAQVAELEERLAGILSQATGKGSNARSPSIPASNSFSTPLSPEPIEEYQVINSSHAADDSPNGSRVDVTESPRSASSPRPPLQQYQRSSGRYTGAFRTIHGPHRRDGSVGGYQHQQAEGAQPWQAQRRTTSESMRSYSSHSDKTA